MMTNDQAILARFAPHGVPDKDQTQKTLTDEFIGRLLLRRDQSLDEVTRDFARRYHGVLSWLGEARQDEMLRAAMRETGIDLSHWLEAA